VDTVGFAEKNMCSFLSAIHNYVVWCGQHAMSNIEDTVTGVTVFCAYNIMWCFLRSTAVVFLQLDS